jgi:hypothetical protein
MDIIRHKCRELVAKWRKEANQYQSQVDEAAKAGLESPQTVNMVRELRRHATELEQLVGQHDPV